MRKVLLCLLLLAGQAHAQTYSNLYSPWMPWDTRIKYAGTMSLLDASGVEVSKAALNSVFNTVTVVFPVQVAPATVTKIRISLTAIGTNDKAVADLAVNTIIDYTLSSVYAAVAGSTPTFVYTPMSFSPSLVATAPLPVVVPPPVADTIPPVVSITAPLAGATLVGTNPLTASASDNVGVVGVQFLVDGANFSAEITAPPYTTIWNSTTAADGAHTVSARARDAAGNSAISAPLTVKVSNAPPPPPPPVGIVPSKPGDSVPPLAALILPDGGKWTLVGNAVFRNGVNTNVPYPDTNLIYISAAGALRASSPTHGYICFGTAWGVGGAGC